MGFVLDASVAAAWAFEDEDHPVATLAFALVRQEQTWAPGILWFEVRNTLIVNERRGRLTENDTSIFLRELSRFPISIDRFPDETSVLALARRHRLTVYDAAYLQLAQRENIALATLDAKLASAARAENVPLVGESR